jgi:NTP pyrophosphatase (non-canonical NTP hydrolase)
MFLNLIGEIGEFASKVAKAIRKDKAMIDFNNLITERKEFMTDEEIADLRKEAGDVLWQLSGLCTVMGWSLEEVAQENLDKLSSRKVRGVVDGNGDNR